MSTVEQLAADKDYESILSLEGEKYDNYKCITLIKLERYVEALAYAKSSPFELAYIYYKLKNFKKCLETIRSSRRDEQKFKILEAQALYGYGKYNSAYKVLSTCSLDEEEVVVSLEAARSMASLANASESRVPSKYSVTKRDDETELKDAGSRKFKSSELEEEFWYNKTFAHLLDEQKYVQILTELSEKHRGGLLKRQLNNVLGNFEKIDPNVLGDSDLGTLRFNKKEATVIEEPMHYQRNVVEIDGRYWPSVDYACYKKAYDCGYDVGDARVPYDSNNLLLLRAFLDLKRMFRGERFGRRFFEKKSDTLQWKIVELLALKKDQMSQNYDRLVSVLALLGNL